MHMSRVACCAFRIYGDLNPVNLLDDCTTAYKVRHRRATSSQLGTTNVSQAPTFIREFTPRSDARQFKFIISNTQSNGAVFYPRTLPLYLTDIMVELQPAESLQPKTNVNDIAVSGCDRIYMSNQMQPQPVGAQPSRLRLATEATSGERTRACTIPNAQPHGAAKGTRAAGAMGGQFAGAQAQGDQNYWTPERMRNAKTDAPCRRCRVAGCWTRTAA